MGSLAGGWGPVGTTGALTRPASSRLGCGRGRRGPHREDERALGVKGPHWGVGREEGNKGVAAGG